MPTADFEAVLHQGANAKSSLGALFEVTCTRFPNRIAVSAGRNHATYSELLRDADQVVAALPHVTGAIVAIFLDRSISMVTAMLGVIRAGASYLPLDTTYPTARLELMIADAKPSAILTTRALSAFLPQGKAILIFVEELEATSTRQLPALLSQPDQIAYIIYTSGSTGQPKGVQVTHQNVERLFTSTQRWFYFNEHDVWTMFHSFAFDFSVWEMWGPLLSGGRLVIVPFPVSRSPQDFYSLLVQEQVTVLNQTPSAFLMLANEEVPLDQQELALRLVILGGEALNLQTLRPWFARYGDAKPEIINMYGITETTVHVTYRRISLEDCLAEKDSLIGQPIDDLQLYLLDESQQPVQDGEAGEICIGGAGVAAGYLNRPELNAVRFVTDPFSTSKQRMYRSGDLGRRRTDGELVYLGRADRQVKINGFRIELGEIESATMECGGVIQTSVLAHSDATTGARLVCYYVGNAKTSEVSRQLAERLPMHLRPSFYVQLDAMPLNGNGKIDQTALPSPLMSASEPAMLPATATESIVLATWQSALLRTGIGREENFFDIGGTSLLLIAVRTALQQHLDRAIPVTMLFEFTTIRTLAAKLAEVASSAPALKGQNHLQDQARLRAEQQRRSFSRARAERSSSR